MKIGGWIKRRRDDSKWHRIESIISGDAITHCGRRMQDWKGSFETSDIEQSPRCKRCA